MHKRMSSHGDYDHLGDAINLIDNFKVKKILINSNRINKLEEKIIKRFNNIEIAKQDYFISIGDIELLQLNKNLKDENDSSLVFLGLIKNKKILLMGDASKKTEKEIMKEYDIGQVDILKVGHHGSKTSSSEEFIKEINPKLVLISAGKNNKFGHPNENVLERLKQLGCKVFRTDLGGEISIEVNMSSKYRTISIY